MTLILFVCGNNRSRSPMAAAYVQSRLKAMGNTDIQVASAGLHTRRQDMVRDAAIEALKAIGAEPIQVGTTQLLPKLVKSSSLILCMTEKQLEEILAVFPSAKSRTRTLMSLIGSDYSIPDPLGDDLQKHVVCLKTMRPALDALLEKVTAS